MSDLPLEPSSWLIDPDHSSIDFSVRHLMVSRVRGTFQSFSGTITVEDGTAGVVVEIDTSSLTTRNARRDEHLRSGDFLDTHDHPKATFESTGMTASGDGYVLTGDLTLRGVTKQVDLHVSYLGRNGGVGKGEVVGFEATTTITRQDFGITIDVPTETGDKVVGDAVSLSFDVEAVRLQTP
ncbi:YceI family protein [Tsukamurella sp. 8F]|uniref:YceI family protein n=1 Tax=unclassified Tsukamurella TaxID=2633480 RepID=UPI0023BA04CB|nr:MULTISPECIES: YceI family protein [unclassified Tsukamurella]MDF0528598.1 YceI family protein [Tsukamurella sp. 8J]MDF0585560.1 YceI family protein [Tsukamurella sp. 8F]